MELDFLKLIPTTWDETRFIDGYPGRYVVLARRHGDKWYVAGLNAQKEPLTLTVDLSMFDKNSAISQLVDTADKKGNITGVATEPLKTDKKGLAKIKMQPNGGIVIFQ